MPRSLAFVFALATLSASALAQNAYLAEPDSTGNAPAAYSQDVAAPQNQAAPIERAAAGSHAKPQMATSQIIGGVWLRTAPDSAVRTVSADKNSTEIRVEHGRANVSVHHPSENTQILVDLPGGQTALVKDGLYTFNADTNTVRVLYGEADAFPSGEEHATKVKEDHEFAFGADSHAKEINRSQASADLLGGSYGEGDRHDAYRGSYAPYGYGFAYGEPYYGYGPYWGGPYWAYGGWGPWGYPAFGYPGFGYPGFGFGLGYYGGFGDGYYGGFRGGIRGGIGRR